jgi:hypothetical protein
MFEIPRPPAEDPAFELGIGEEVASLRGAAAVFGTHIGRRVMGAIEERGIRDPQTWAEVSTDENLAEPLLEVGSDIRDDRATAWV